VEGIDKGEREFVESGNYDCRLPFSVGPVREARGVRYSVRTTY
jgi:hypothetical protein